ncbi:MAG TPA: VWA domain-containing protein [Vicinamibacteria bacterium]|nr:VWA domain-containing protein [Vicinamibacteria bacterium]
MTRRWTATSLLLLAVVPGTGGAVGDRVAAGQDRAAAAPDDQKAATLPPVKVEVVRLDVVVTERRGRPRTDLKREDFSVLEDGRAQQIIQFQALGRPEPRATPAAPAASPRGEGEAEYLLPARYIVLAIDDVHMEADSLVRTRKALARFLEEDLRVEDQVALVTTSGSSALSQEFTADRTVLLETLSRLSAQGRQAGWTGAPYITDYQAELIEAGDTAALDAAIQEILVATPIQDAGNAERLARQKAHAIFNESVYNARLTLTALERLCRGLSGLTGRKSVLLVSDGFVTGMIGGSGASFDLRRIADAATRAGVAVYSLDTSGLTASPPMADASSLTRMVPSTVGQVEAMRRRSEGAERDAMHALAADTGGFLVEDSNDLRLGLRQILKDTETYYVLAYESTNTKRNGAFRRIEVRVPGRRDLKVRTRSGYLAPDDSRLRAPVTEASARREEQRESEIGAALGALAPLNGIPVRMSADFVSLDGVNWQLVVSGSVDVSALPFATRRDRRQATVETAGLVYDEAGHVAASVPSSRTSMDLTEPEYAELVRRGLPFQRMVALKPGRYQVRLAVREDATGLLGSAWRRLELPDLAQGRLAVSSLFLMKDERPAGVAPGAEAAPDLRSVQGLARYGRADSLYVQLQAYNVLRDKDAGADLVVQPAVLQKGVVLATAAPEAMEAGAAGPLVHVARIVLQRFEPGDYELLVTLTDRRANASVARVVPFTVE